MLFELSVGGHYPEYIAHLIYHWHQRQAAQQLLVVVSPPFIQQHQEVVNLAQKYEQDRVKIIAIAQAEYAQLKSFNTALNRNLRTWQEFQIMRSYALKLEADRVFIPYIDSLQIPLILNPSLPFTYSGIYFRPSFHYHNLVNHSVSWQDRFQSWREKLTLSLLLKQRQLKTLFCLDPIAIEPIDRLSSQSKAVYLADPVQIHPDLGTDIGQLKSSLAIEPARQIYLLAGCIGKRKGLDKVLDAIALLPPELCQKFCFLVVGPIEASYYQQCLQIANRLTSNLPIQIIFKNQHILEVEIQQYFQLADVVLALYQRHVGMSAILTRAAIAQKPVLATDYGLMGEITRRYQLGLTVNSTDISAIAQGLTVFLTESRDSYCDLELMKQYAAQNTPEKFTNTIFQYI